MRITYTHHARRRMRERAVSAADIRNVLLGHAQAHPSSRKRELWGRTLGGAPLKVVYTEARSGEFRIVTVIKPDH